MGTKYSIPKDDLEYLTTSTNFNKDELNKYYKKFLNNTPEGNLNQEQFEKIFSSISTTSPSKTITQKLFRSFDGDNNGRVSFKELMTSLSLTMKGTSDEKLRWLFRVYDLDNDGRITLDEVLDVVESLYTASEDNFVAMGCAQIALRAAEIEHMFKMVDKDSNGYWCVEEFVASMQSHPAFLKMLKIVERE